VILGLDHLVIAVDDPDAAVSELAAVIGVTPGVAGGRHAAWGTRNRLLWLGDAYIELLTVFDPRLAERSALARAALEALASGPAAITWAIASDDIDLDRVELNAAGAALGAATPGERRRPDGQLVRWRVAMAQEPDLARPFLIEHDLFSAEWTSDDRLERAALPGRTVGLDLPLEAIEGLPRASGGGAQLGEHFVRATGVDSGLPIVRIGGLDRAVEADALGCRWIVG
jgi:hypothetical protein